MRSPDYFNRVRTAQAGVLPRTGV